MHGTREEPITYQWEAWSKIISEALPLLRIYWHSGGVLYPDELPWDPDLALAAEMERAGRLWVFTVRRGQRLIGLNGFNVGGVLFRKTARVANGIILYLLPSERRGSVGVRLIKEAESGLRERGINLIIYTPSSSVDLTRLLKMLGYRQQGGAFEKLLKAQVEK